jgi:hypothetical protein
MQPVIRTLLIVLLLVMIRARADWRLQHDWVWRRNGGGHVRIKVDQVGQVE